MSKYQPTPRYSTTKGAALARRINAGRTIAQSILDATIYVESDVLAQEVEAGNSEQVGRLHIAQGQRLWIVASKFANRYYVVADGECSSYDDRVAAACIAKVQAYRLKQAA